VWTSAKIQGWALSPAIPVVLLLLLLLLAGG